MSDLTLARPHFLRRHAASLVGGSAAAAIAGWLLLRPGAGTMPRPHAPDLSLLAQAPVAVQLHVAAAVLALAIGTALLAGVKGDRLHRTLGWTWVMAMATTAISSLFIRQINAGDFSFIHLISGWTIVALPMAVYAARRHKVADHRRAMTGMFVGGLLIAGSLAFLPGRMMWVMVFG